MYKEAGGKERPFYYGKVSMAYRDFQWSTLQLENAARTSVDHCPELAVKKALEVKGANYLAFGW